MFERFTDRARQIVVFSQEEARLLNHGYIGTEHILLGIIHEHDSVAGLVLTEDLGVDLERVREMVEEMVGEGRIAPTGHIPFTPRAKKVLELALREALQLGHNYIGPEHILLGLIREGEGIGATVLAKLGLQLSDVRQAIIHKLSGYERTEPEDQVPVILLPAHMLTLQRALAHYRSVLNEGHRWVDNPKRLNAELDRVSDLDQWVDERT
jgi:ATP-dependent Clp protease ATP-binding subunit ClpC